MKKAMSMVEKLTELVGRTSSALPADVIKAIEAARRREKRGSAASTILELMLENCRIAKKDGVPLCQDTGTLTFFVSDKLRETATPDAIKRAVRAATKKGYLRKNTIDAVTGRSLDDNCAEGAPVVHYGDYRGVTLLMKGGGSENMSRQYSLPDGELGAERDLAGVEKCVLDAVKKIKGYGCAPGILGVCVGGDRATGYEVAKRQLLRSLAEKPTAFESRLLKKANALGIGPMGLGGKTTLLGVKVASRTRVPASYFVTVAYMCWACRRGSL